MGISSDISSRFWNLPQTADNELAREKSSYDDLILKHHTERKISQEPVYLHPMCLMLPPIPHR